MSELADALRRTAERVAEYRRTVGDRPVARPVEPGELEAALGGPLPDEGADPEAVIEQLVAAVEPGLVATAGPRYFGFVVGGVARRRHGGRHARPGWDQMAFNPSARRPPPRRRPWPPGGSGISSASRRRRPRHHDRRAGARTPSRSRPRGIACSRDAGWDVEADGLHRARRPSASSPARSATRRSTGALRLLGIGREPRRAGRGRRERRDRPRRPRRRARRTADRPTIVCAQAGNVNTGASTTSTRSADSPTRHGAWVHVDGAFGLWAAASPRHAPPRRGRRAGRLLGGRRAQVAQRPLRLRFRVLRRPRRARRVDGLHRLPTSAGTDARGSWAPESSRRARGFADVGGAARARPRRRGRAGRPLLRAGRAVRRAARARDGVEIVNEVVLNQVLVGFGDTASAPTR